jgi:hypothetical protein
MAYPLSAAQEQLGELVAEARRSEDKEAFTQVRSDRRARS